LPENPLLPHNKLKELYLLMLRCRELERKRAKSKTGAREALLAATSIHLLPGDLLCGSPDDAIALARGLQAAGTDGVVLTYAHAKAAEPGWMNALSWSQEAGLPLILVCADATGWAGSKVAGKRSWNQLTWGAVSKLSKKTRIPILAVDGEDAVAVYRCMQESVIRARNGGGPAILWAVMTPTAKTLPRGRQPLARLESYLKVRNIKLPKRS
jgi:hypothetical protein